MTHPTDALHPITDAIFKVQRLEDDANHRGDSAGAEAWAAARTFVEQAEKAIVAARRKQSWARPRPGEQTAAPIPERPSSRCTATKDGAPCGAPTERIAWRKDERHASFCDPCSRRAEAWRSGEACETFWIVVHETGLVLEEVYLSARSAEKQAEQRNEDDPGWRVVELVAPSVAGDRLEELRAAAIEILHSNEVDRWARKLDAAVRASLPGSPGENAAANIEPRVVAAAPGTLEVTIGPGGLTAAQATAAVAFSRVQLTIADFDQMNEKAMRCDAWEKACRLSFGFDPTPESLAKWRATIDEHRDNAGKAIGRLESEAVELRREVANRRSQNDADHAMLEAQVKTISELRGKLDVAAAEAARKERGDFPLPLTFHSGNAIKEVEIEVGPSFELRGIFTREEAKQLLLFGKSLAKTPTAGLDRSAYIASIASAAGEILLRMPEELLALCWQAVKDGVAPRLPTNVDGTIASESKRRKFQCPKCWSSGTGAIDAGFWRCVECDHTWQPDKLATSFGPTPLRQGPPEQLLVKDARFGELSDDDDRSFRIGAVAGLLSAVLEQARLVAPSLSSGVERALANLVDDGDPVWPAKEMVQVAGQEPARVEWGESPIAGLRQVLAMKERLDQLGEHGRTDRDRIAKLEASLADLATKSGVRS